VFTDTMISSMSGGIVAELGGGKFANGARSAAFVSLYNHFNRPNNFRNRYNRMGGKVDILGRNQQQQAHDRHLFRENQKMTNKYNMFRRDPLNTDMRQLHETIENLIDYRDLFPVQPASKWYYDKDGFIHKYR